MKKRDIELVINPTTVYHNHHTYDTRLRNKGLQNSHKSSLTFRGISNCVNPPSLPARLEASTPIAAAAGEEEAGEEDTEDEAAPKRRPPRVRRSP